jgi:subfamily B ATP-binding cassette protein HlyB/CyaB
MIVGRFMLPMQRLIQLWQEFQQVRVSVGRLGELMNTPTEPRNAAALPDMETSIGALEFRHVRFRHRPDDAWILDDVSIAIEPGELVGIVGPSGSGKSTVGSLLQGLYIPEHGAVQVDGLNTRHMDLTRLRRRIAVVRQDTRLFNRSVRENIALASPQADDKRLWSTLELVGAAEFVRRLPRGLDTFLGEGGVNLSGGERQRLAIARALIGEPQVLVLDEATSAVDFEAEEILQSNMKRICQGRTVIIIAHRLSALRSVNRVLTIRKGRIEEDGRPRDLIANGGYFANLVHAQAELMGFRLYREAS